MRKVFIPTDFFLFEREQELSPLVRPFYYKGAWQVSSNQIQRWFNSNDWQVTLDWELADVILFPGHAHHYFRNGHQAWLKNICANAYKKGISAYIFIAGDFGVTFDDVPGLIYFRQGGFVNQLSTKNKGFPFILSDQLQILFKTESIAERLWEKEPAVGFCGHASSSIIKAAKEKLKFLIENVHRFFQKPIRRDYEPLFASALERWKLLYVLQNNPQIKSNFIFRKHYRDGAQTPIHREYSTLEYYKNLRDSAYILCVRGGGNFSVRLYETLMMGRIPVFINTDCLLPFPEIIPWKEHMVWIEWEERHLIVEKILEFHNSLSPEKFLKLQYRNRQLWKEKLSLGWILEYLTTNPNF